MGFFKKESFIKKGIIVILIVLLTNFCAPTVSRAADISEAISNFLLLIPDGVFYLLQGEFCGDGDVRITVHSDKKEKGEEVSLGEVYIKSGGPLNPFSYVKVLGAGIYNLAFADGEYILPHISYTPYNIFANNIPILDADFFGNRENEKIYIYNNTNVGKDVSHMISEYSSKDKDEVIEYIKSELNCRAYDADKKKIAIQYMQGLIKTYLENGSNDTAASRVAMNKLDLEADSWKRSGILEVVNGKDYEKFHELVDEAKIDLEEFFGYTTPEEIAKQMCYITDEETTGDSIFSSDYIKFNFDKKFLEDSFIIKEGVIKASEDDIEEQVNSITETELVSSVSVLKPIVSKWYNILRTVAMVGLLSVLVYIGIRILLYSTSAQDKAKYKTMLKDWIVGLCLLFVLHYIMSFTMAVTGYIGDIFKNSDIFSVPLSIYSDTTYADNNSAKDKLNFKKHIIKEGEKAYWECNEVERIRYMITMNTNEDENSISKRIAYILMYIVVMIEVLIFTFQYLKRVITMAMLTLIAPLVALTYPIDKITDGKAQGFNMWIKEYIFNALLQPMHLILYAIIMSSAFALVVTNPIYAIVALGCMTPMEKLLRKIFGFGKAESVGVFGGAAGAAVVMSTIGSLQKLRRRPPMAKGKERDDGLKLWDNKKSFDSESMLFGEPNENGIKLDNSDEKTKNKVDKSDKNPEKGILLPNQINKDPTRKILLPDSVDKSKINKQEKPKTENGRTSLPIRKMSSTATKPSMPKRTIKNPKLYALGQVGKSYGRKLTRDLTTGNVLKKAAKLATSAAVGGTLGTVGLAAGIASGDLGKTVQYTTTAGVAGATLGSSFSEGTFNGIENVKDTYQTAYASADESYATDKRIKEFMKNEQNIQYLESRYTDKQERQEIINLMKESAQYGITDVRDVSAMHEMKKQLGLDSEQAIAVAKMSNKIGDISQPKVREEYEKYFAKKGYSDKKIKLVLNRIEKFKKERD